MSRVYREPSEPFPQPPDSTPDFAAMRRVRGRRFAIIGGVVAVVAMSAAGIGLFVSQRATRQATESSAAELRSCLLQGPLEAGETPSLRFRRLQLAAMTRSEAERLVPGARIWPLECRPAAGKALDSFTGAAGQDALVKPLAELTKKLDQRTAISEDLSALVDQTIAALDKAAPGPIASAAEKLPPMALNVDALAKLSSISKEGTSLGHSFTEDNPGLSLAVLIDEKDLPDAPLLCEFNQTDPDASCRTLSELKGAQQHGLRLLGTSDPGARTLVFAGQRGSEGVFLTGSGTYVDRLYSYGGYARKDGSVAILGWDDKARNLVLSRKDAEGPAIRLTLKPDFRVGNFFYGSQILWDEILVRGITRDDERRLFVLPLAEADKRTFELADIGELPEPGFIREGEEERPHVSGCRTEQMMVVRVRGNGNDFLTFRIGGHFSHPVEAPAFGLLGCNGTTASVVRVEHGRSPSPLLYHDACTSAGCTRTALKNDALDRSTQDLKPLDPERIAAVDLGGKLLVVWSAGDRAGLRMRIAAPAAFDRGTDVVVLDDRVHDGKASNESTLLGFRLYSREHFAVLLLSTVAGMHALRIDPDGTVRPWAIKHLAR
ncbi:MAG: hypothetical protein ABIP39_15260 [Polyangiaceae bacterium]